ncbi:hypothetical protein BDM02DRAFT_3194209 [Thelephora ganbajun]|uniref:Uncharacterized protein n=1 Tax=Thelephora ganbajun TaxID=370292 RepID=A0ACB6YWW7_THEGA|nr:hypothetical protein BDM02DRAFT_3194209 [Thelephora ganbajun]
MVAGGPCTLDFSFSPEVEWALVSHQRVLVVLLASPFHKRRFLRVASRKARLGFSHLLLTHRLLEHPIVVLPFWTAEAFDVYLREMIALPIKSSGLPVPTPFNSSPRVKNAALEREVEGLKGQVARLEGEFGVLLARVEALEWVIPSEYLSVEDLLRAGGGGEVESMDSGEAAELGLRSDFQALVDRLDPVDISAPLFPHSF